MKRDVEEYERTIQRKVQLEEQARRKKREAAHLTDKANSIKKEIIISHAHSLQLRNN